MNILISMLGILYFLLNKKNKADMEYNLSSRYQVIGHGGMEIRIHWSISMVTSSAPS